MKGYVVLVIKMCSSEFGKGSKGHLSILEPNVANFPWTLLLLPMCCILFKEGSQVGIHEYCRGLERADG